MYDTGKILAGIIIFLGAITFPIWYDAVTGKAATKPEPKIITSEKQCVESATYMRDYHMKLLHQWRDQVVRENMHLYKGIDGKTYNISLTNTCLNCHSNKKDFCDQCHNYVGVNPTCWNCHIIPEEKG